MKRPLAIVGQASESRSSEPLRYRVAGSHVLVADTGDGTAAALFADLLVSEGASLVAEATSIEPDLCIVLRTPSTSPSQGRAESLEARADFILGAPRAAFARLVVEELSAS